MPCKFSDVFSCDDISDDDVFIAAAADEFGVIFGDVESVDVIVMDIFVVFDHEIFRGIVQTYASILRPCHAVFSGIVKLDNIDRAGMTFS